MLAYRPPFPNDFSFLIVSTASLGLGCFGGACTGRFFFHSICFYFPGGNGFGLCLLGEHSGWWEYRMDGGGPLALYPYHYYCFQFSREREKNTNKYHLRYWVHFMCEEKKRKRRVQKTLYNQLG